MTRVRVVATDLDHTLLLPDGRVGTRTRAVLDAVRARGIVVVPVTARQPIGLVDIAPAAGLDGWALCSNGAFSYHLGTREVGFATTLDPAVQRELATAPLAVRPGARVASVRGHAASGFLAQEGYPELAEFTDHKRHPSGMETGTLDEVTAEPALKLVVREPDVAPENTLETIRALGLTGFAATRSGAPFVEIAHPEVDKASGLARLCSTLGVAREEVVAFGDAPNDLAMLRWAGHGVAVANAEAEVRATADEVTADTNAEEAVAVWLDSHMQAGALEY
ncbi:HAD family hydrolase [Mariniluteicoccus endophyticus]